MSSQFSLLTTSWKIKALLEDVKRFDQSPMYDTAIIWHIFIKWINMNEGNVRSIPIAPANLSDVSYRKHDIEQFSRSYIVFVGGYNFLQIFFLKHTSPQFRKDVRNGRYYFIRYNTG